jgi:hypothetical protein
VTVWPSERPVHLVAARCFPSSARFRLLDTWRQRRPLGSTLRLRAGDWVWLADRAVTIAAVLGAVGDDRWRTWRAADRRQGPPRAPVLLAIGRGLPVYAAHQGGPADQRRRQARAARQAQQRRRRGDGAAASTDRAWGLLSTEATWQAAVRRSTGRFSTEGTSGDWKSWGWETVGGQAMTAGLVDGLTGLAARGAIVQAAIGAAAGRTREAGVRARQRHWATTDRLSVFRRGRLGLQDRAYHGTPWLSQVLTNLSARLTAGTATPPATAPTPLPQQPPLQEAA